MDVGIPGVPSETSATDDQGQHPTIDDQPALCTSGYRVNSISDFLRSMWGDLKDLGPPASWLYSALGPH